MICPLNLYVVWVGIHCVLWHSKHVRNNVYKIWYIHWCWSRSGLFKYVKNIVLVYNANEHEIYFHYETHSVERDEEMRHNTDLKIGACYHPLKEKLKTKWIFPPVYENFIVQSARPSLSILLRKHFAFVHEFHTKFVLMHPFWIAIKCCRHENNRYFRKETHPPYIYAL